MDVTTWAFRRMNRKTDDVQSMLHRKVREYLRKKGVKELTTIQKLAIPKILSGFNTLIVAPTGSGKTEAALLPVATLMLQDGIYGKLRTLYITPLRALNRDIGIRALELFRHIGMNVDVWHGDTPSSRRKKIMEQPPEVLVTTPESLTIMLANKRMKEILKDVKYVIIDELHELIESKRGSELAVTLERLSEMTRIQRIGISATISEIDKAKLFLSSGRFTVEVIDYSKKPPLIDVVIEDGFDKMVEKVEQIVKDEEGMILVFTNTRDTAEQVGKILRERIGERVYVHHGSLSKKERERVEKKARRGEIKVVVATSSLELGIDIGSVTRVIQFASPRRATRLTQRVGRARHRPNERPTGTLVTGLKPYEVLEAVVLARRTVNGDLEKLYIHEAPLDALAHQLVGILVDGKRKLDDALKTIQRSYPFWKLRKEDFEEVAELLISNNLIKCDNEGCEATKKGIIYYRTTGMIVESKRIPVKVYGGDIIGTLDEEFVVELEPGNLFILGGRVWKVIGIDSELVMVEPAESEGMPPAWEGELIPVEYNVAREVGALKRAFDKVIQNYPLDDEMKERVEKIIKDAGEVVATDRRIVVEVEDRTIVYNVHGGSKLNNALGYVLCYIARQMYGSCSFNTTPYHVILVLSKHIRAEEAANMLRRLPRFNIEKILVDEIMKSRLFKWRMLRVLVRMGLLNRKKLNVEELRKVEKGLVRSYRDTVVGKETLREILVEKVSLEELKQFLNSLNKIEIVARDELSNQSKWALMFEGGVKEVKVESSSVIEQAVRMRLENREVKMVCMLCGNVWEGKVKDVPLKCPKCGAGFVAPIFKEEGLEEAAMKIAKGEKLRGPSKKMGEEARMRANLLMGYGRDALLALAGRGIGAKTARRVLERSRISGSLIKEIVSAEKTYLRTRRYW